MDVGRFPRVLSLSAIAGFAFFAHAVRADTFNFALVRCDEAAGELIVKEGSTEDEADQYATPEGYQSKWMDKLVEYISPPDSTPDDATQGTYRHKIKDWQLSCTLRGVAYKVVISPWSANDMVMGQCGGGDPDVELTVLRDKRVLVRNLQLGGSCSIGPNDPVYVGVVKLSESRKIAALDDIHIPYSDMPTLDQRKLVDPNRKSNSPSGVEQAATACQSENGELIPSAGGRILGPAGSHVHLYRRHPALCGSADAATCEVKAYLVPEDVVDVGTTCGDYVRVRYVGKTRLSIGWVEKKSIGGGDEDRVASLGNGVYQVSRRHLPKGTDPAWLPHYAALDAARVCEKQHKSPLFENWDMAAAAAKALVERRILWRFTCTETIPVVPEPAPAPPTQSVP